MMWFDGILETDTKKHIFNRNWTTTCLEDDNHYGFNIIGTPLWTFHEHENLHFDNEEDVHMSSKNTKESGYGLNLHLLTIL